MDAIAVRSEKSRIHWPWVLLAYLSLFVFGLTDNIRGPIYPEFLNHFQISHSQGSFFFSVASMTNMLGAFYVPRMIDYFGHFKTLIIFMTILFVSQLGFFLSPGFGLILFFCFFYGIAIGGLGVTQNLLVLVATPVEHRQQIQSGLHACYGAASFMAPGLVIAVSLMGFTWKDSFGVVAAIIFLFLGGLYFIKTQPYQKQGDAEVIVAPLYRRRESFYAATILAIYVALEILVGSRLALFMREERGIDLRGSSFWVFVFYGGLFLGRMLLSVYRPPFAISSQLKCSLTGTALLIVGAVFGLPELLAFTGFTLAPFYPLMMTAMSLLFHEKVDRAASLGIALSGISVVSMHAAVGFMSDLFGLRFAFLLGLLLSLIAFVMILLHKRYFGRAIP